MRSLLIWGAGGHAAVVADVARLAGWTISGFIDDCSNGACSSVIREPLVYDRITAENMVRRGVRYAAVAIGDPRVRLEKARILEAWGCKLPPLIHPRAIVADSACVEAGAVVCPGAVVAPRTHIGRLGIINTLASADHECELGEATHLCPGAHLAGRIVVGRGTWIGVGACVRDRVRLGEWCYLGAGAALVADLPNGSLAFGVPAKPRGVSPFAPAAGVDDAARGCRVREEGGCMFRWVPRSWRRWLNQTRLPGLRQLAEAVRLTIRLKNLARILDVDQLAQMRAAIEQSSQQCQTAQPRFTAIEERVHLLFYWHKHLREQTDLLKSAKEVPAEWFDEFQCWKQTNPLPEAPLVSVCVATWNRAKLLTQRCLPSLMQQTYKHLEIVVVGDGCTDDTAERIADLGDPRIHFVNLPQRGRYPDDSSRRWLVAGTIPMNHALSLCRGDFITHLDDDDEHDRTRVEKLVAFTRENNLDFVWHPFHYERAPGEWELHPCGELRLTQVTTSSIFYRRWLARIGWDINAHLLNEPGDWNRLRKFLYLGIKAQRYPEPLLRHYREQGQNSAAA